MFPAGRICRGERFGPPTRYHLHESVIQRAVTVAGRKAGLTKRVGCHTFPPFIRDPAAGRRVGHPHHPRTARSCRCQHDDDLHTRTESRWARSEEPDGPLVVVFTRGAFAMNQASLEARRHVYLRRLAVIPAPAGNPPWHFRPSCVLTCAASARSRPTDTLAVARMIAKGCQRSTPIVVELNR